MTGIGNKPTISFIVPALNEEAKIAQTVRETLEVVKDRFSDYELLLINDGSTDRTGEIMEELARQHNKIRVIHNSRNLGLGLTYQRGVRAARFEYVTIVYGDGGVPSESLPSIFEQIGKADLVLPYMVNLREIKTLTRFTTSLGYTTLMNLLFGQRIRYYNGPAVHRRELLRQIEITSIGFGFQAEIILKQLRLGCSYVQLGIRGSVGNERSRAVSTRNLISVGKTIIDLVWEVYRLDPKSLNVNVRRKPGQKTA